MFCFMKTILFASALAAAASLAAPAAHAIPAPIHEWTFDDGTARDVVGSLDGTLNGAATIVGGKLILDGNRANGGSYMSTGFDTLTLTAKTLVSWVSLANLTQSGGTALSVVQMPGQQFDAIDFAEFTPAQWTAGSDYANRSVGNDGGAAVTDTGEHMVAITYGATGISLYVDGALYANGRSVAPYAFAQPNYLIGLRHPAAESGNGLLTGSVDQASVYASALSAADITGLYAQGATVPEPATWGLMLAGLGCLGAMVGWRRQPLPVVVSRAGRRPRTA